MADVEPNAFVLKLTLLDTQPVIWRRVVVPGSMTLAQLHGVLQAVVGWEDRHLYEFEIEDRWFGPIDEDAHDELEDATDVELGDVVTAGDHFFYEYDFGDGWRLEVEVESSTNELGTAHATCTDGERAGPPEDCGGPDGYSELIEALADTDHPDHEDVRSWVGGGFDPAAFSLGKVNTALDQVR
jgi:hypothetical protein